MKHQRRNIGSHVRRLLVRIHISTHCWQTCKHTHAGISARPVDKAACFSNDAEQRRARTAILMMTGMTIILMTRIKTTTGTTRTRTTMMRDGGHLQALRGGLFPPQRMRVQVHAAAGPANPSEISGGGDDDDDDDDDTTTRLTTKRTTTTTTPTTTTTTTTKTTTTKQWRRLHQRMPDGRASGPVCFTSSSTPSPLSLPHASPFPHSSPILTPLTPFRQSLSPPSNPPHAFRPRRQRRHPPTVSRR